MSGLLDALAGAVGTVQTLSGQATDPNTATPPVEDRLTAIEQFVTTWGPLLEKLEPLLEKI
jgi:hypothetical protein